MKEVVYPVGLLDLSEPELLYLIGEKLSASRGGGALALDDFGEIMALAKDWLKEHGSKFQSRICSHPVVTTLLNDEALSNKRIILFLTIADLVSEENFGISPFIIASMIIQHGLTEFCAAAPGE